MSLYSDRKIKTKIIRVAYHNNSRSEFRLNLNSPCLSNMRLLNIGSAQTGGTNVSYNVGNGVGSLFQHISLYCGNQLVSQLRNVHQWLAFDYCNKSNTEELSKTNVLKQNALGFLTLQDKITRQQSQTYLTGDVETTPTGWIRLDDCLHFLKSTAQVPCDVAEWRVVIEWTKDLTNFNGQAVGYVAPTKLQICEPILVVDEINEAKSPNQIAVSYWDLETDRIIINAVGAGVAQTTKAKMDGYNSKVVGRMLMVNSQPLHLNAGLGFDRSVPMLNEKIQFVLNGKKFLAFDGITPQNKTQMLNDVYGAMNCAFGNDKTALAGSANIYGANTDMAGFAYGGVKLAQRVFELQWEYTRTGGATAPYQDAFNFMVFGEVAKQFAYKGGKAIVANA